MIFARASPSRPIGSASSCPFHRREVTARPEPFAPLLVDLADLHRGSKHVRDVGLATADDDVVWRYAAEHGFTIVSKDADFHERSFLLGQPPNLR